MTRLWYGLGRTAHWVLFVPIVLYSRLSRPRTRVLVLHDNEVLLVKNWLGAGKWALPGGGIHNGEAHSRAAIREVKEELGIAISEEHLRNLGHYSSSEGLGLVTKYYLFTVELPERPAINRQVEEITDAQWFNITSAMSAGKGVSATVRDALGVWRSSQNLV